jgi:hypothetical protein
MCTVLKFGGLTSRICDAVLCGLCTIRNLSDPEIYIILTSCIYKLYFILFYFLSFYTIILQKILANNYMEFNIVE